ncbi:unnamed protein product [Meloidogyne enterolobii]|uniref:Uncharacterized protein n=1 Tax=Meloidogyne enterolobii TaxID=390850 RepID=A0ACB0ZLK4_MELEN
MGGQGYKIILFNVKLNEKNEPHQGQEIGTKFSQKYDTVTFKLSKEWVEYMEVYEEDTGHFKYKKNNQFSIYVFGNNENVWGFLVRYLRVENGLDQNL